VDNASGIAVVRRSNNFDALRLLFAVLVIFSHSFALVGLPEPIIWTSTVGAMAVHGFFAISGYLIAKSLLRASSLAEYASSRFLRIVPGLVVAMIVAFALATLQRDYASNPIPGLVNGPVWTLTWEVVAYGAIALIAVIGVLTRTTFGAVVAAFWMLVLANSGSQDPFFLAVVPMLLMFATGALIAVGQFRIGPVAVVIAGVGLLVTANFWVFSTIAGAIGAVIPFAYVSPDFSLGFVHKVIYWSCFPVVVVWIGRLTHPHLALRWDISYGLYTSAWPIGQSLVHVMLAVNLALNPWLVLGGTIVLTVPLAIASWLVVERPALRLKEVLRLRAVQHDLAEK